MGLNNITKNTNFILLFIFPLLMKCRSNSEASKQFEFNLEEMNKILNQNGNNIALLSCLRCGCFVDVYNKEFKEKGTRPTEYILLADTTCNKFLFQVNFLSSNDIEKISDEMYNLTLVKRRDKTIITKILQVEDSKNLEVAIGRFFKK
jgi:predicted nucleic-acid-binding Zn-ribbon protein